MLALKASNDDIDNAVRHLSREIRECAQREDLENAIEKQRFVNKGFSSNMCLGRWVWNTGKCRVGKGIPWNVQTMNRCVLSGISVQCICVHRHTHVDGS